MDVLYEDIGRLMLDLKECVALTGAGVSAESGIDTFRSKDGLWKRYDPSVYASIEVFKQDPSKYWTIRGDFIRNYDEYRPNPGHYALAELERLGLVRSVITQNIDGLHTKAGSRKVIEIHGSLRETYCLKCGKEYVAPNVPEGVPPYCDCGGVLKPNTVLSVQDYVYDPETETITEYTESKNVPEEQDYTLWYLYAQQHPLCTQA